MTVLKGVRKFDGRDLNKQVAKCPEVRETRRGKGDHVVHVGTNGHIVTIPDRTTGKGIWCAIGRQLKALGIFLGVVAFFVLVIAVNI